MSCVWPVVTAYSEVSLPLLVAGQGYMNPLPLPNKMLCYKRDRVTKIACVHILGFPLETAWISFCFLWYQVTYLNGKYQTIKLKIHLQGVYGKKRKVKKKNTIKDKLSESHKSDSTDATQPHKQRDVLQPLVSSREVTLAAPAFQGFNNRDIQSLVHQTLKRYLWCSLRVSGHTPC